MLMILKVLQEKRYAFNDTENDDIANIYYFCAGCSAKYFQLH